MAVFVGHPIVVGDTDDIHDTEVVKVLTRAKDANGNEYIFLKGVASTVAGSWVAYDEQAVTALLDTDVAATLVSPIAVAQAAIVANKYGWYMIFGSCSAGAATVVDNTKVFSTATAGVCDDTGTAGNQIIGAYWRSADSSSLATVQLTYPVSGVNVA